MAGASEQPQLHEHVPAELCLGQHASHRVHQHVVRLLDQSIRSGHRFATAGETAESLIELGRRFVGEVRNRRMRHLPTREPHAFNVDDDDVIAAIDIRRVIGFVLAHQHGGNFSGQPSDNLPIAVDDEPFLGAGSRLLHSQGKALVVRGFQTLNGRCSGSRGGHGGILQKLGKTCHSQPVLDETSSPAGRKDAAK